VTTDQIVFSPEELAAAALYLASPFAGGYTNGDILLLEGGFLTVNP